MHLKRYVEIHADYVNITAGTLCMERGSKLSVVGRAPLDTSPVAIETSGGSHASEGGVGNSLTLEDASKPYGSMYVPTLVGSNGGEGGRGGSYIWLYTDDLILDGHLDAGGNASVDGGGGAGGSVYVRCDHSLSGLGYIRADGGDTNSVNAGGGSGGRIAVYMTKNVFDGHHYSTKGGEGPGTYGHGGPGSVYIQEGREIDRTLKETLIIDNSNGQGYHYLTLNETSTSMLLANVEMYNYAKLQVIQDNINRTINIDKVHGDGTGLLWVQRHQKGTLERHTSDDYVSSKLEINLELHDGGEFILSETTFIMGRAPVALDLDGVMRGVLNLVVAEGRKMRVGPNARIVPLQETEISRMANVTFSLLQLDPGSMVEFDPNTGANMIIGKLYVKFAARMMADYLNVSSSELSVEVSAKISCAATDRLDSNTDVLLGSGGSLNVTYGGAGYGGIGGDLNDVSAAGSAYGSLYHPVLHGSRASLEGGHGGGYMILNVGEIAIIDGELSSNGSASVYGGGSGGSLLINVKHIRGIGMISIVGGDGLANSGAGSGGRMAVYSDEIIQFIGQYKSHGGNTNHPYGRGGGGTVYLEDTRNQRPYIRLFIDNNGHPWDS